MSLQKAKKPRLSSYSSLAQSQAAAVKHDTLLVLPMQNNRWLVYTASYSIQNTQKLVVLRWQWMHMCGVYRDMCGTHVTCQNESGSQLHTAGMMYSSLKWWDRRPAGC
jgi:hypothetical protein